MGTEQPSDNGGRRLAYEARRVKATLPQAESCQFSKRQQSAASGDPAALTQTLQQLARELQLNSKFIQEACSDERQSLD